MPQVVRGYGSMTTGTLDSDTHRGAVCAARCALWALRSTGGPATLALRQVAARCWLGSEPSRLRAACPRGSCVAHANGVCLLVLRCSWSGAPCIRARRPHAVWRVRGTGEYGVGLVCPARRGSVYEA